LVSDRARLIDSVSVGQLLLGKYKVESILGLGGMGVVAQCMHIALNERVAIKMMRRDVTADPGAIERFIREAQAAAKLKSEYVARVSDVGSFEDGTHYMVMEYLEGYDLGRLLEQRERLPVGWATELVLQASEALSEAHSLNIVHRDVKPTNLFVTWRPDGTSLIKVLDFGVSKVYGSAELRLTNTQSLLGTPTYMAPEQMRSARNVDPRADIWALGVVLYELVEGRRPFEAESFTELCVMVSIDPPSPMTVAPAELQKVVMRCLEKNPDQRYASMYDLGSDLLPFVKNEKEGVMIVERMLRMQRRQRAGSPVAEASGPVATSVRKDPTTERDAEKKAEAADKKADAADKQAEAADKKAGAVDKKWPEETPTTEPRTSIAQIVDDAIAARSAAGTSRGIGPAASSGSAPEPVPVDRVTRPESIVNEPAPPVVPKPPVVPAPPVVVEEVASAKPVAAPAPAPKVEGAAKVVVAGAQAKVATKPSMEVPAAIPAPPIVPAGKAVPPKADGASEPLPDADTIFEVGSTHVPFEDRRQDDLAQQPLPPLAPAKLPTPRPVTRAVTRPVQRPAQRPEKPSRTPKQQAVMLILGLMLFAAGAGALLRYFL
jgi:serine/threonine-protein kinase